MAIPRTSLRGFLTHARNALRTAINLNQKVTLVIGNESADLDSMTSPVLYAYLRSLYPPRNAFTPLYIPIVNLPAADIALRPEYLAAFRHANIDPEHLITLDDLPELAIIQKKLPPENTKWILVDHNALQGTLGQVYSSRVGGVIDHHEDEGKVAAETEPEPRIIEKSGSCTSLVTEYCREHWDVVSASALSTGAAHGQGESLLDDSATVKVWDAQVAFLGLASVLIDTNNLKSKDKTTEHDRKAVEYLEAKILACPKFVTSYERKDFFDEIDQAKKSIDSLKLHDILRKDYKLWEENGLKLGVSSVVKDIGFLVHKAGTEDATRTAQDAFLGGLEDFAKERDLDVYGLMTSFSSPSGHQRELLVWALNESSLPGAEKFAQEAKEELGLEPWSGVESLVTGQLLRDKRVKIWVQRNVQHSRKRVAPLLREAMR
ncbi:DHH phosphoesterase [Westerdykella ornata]|uniref:DHH phosphoesterase n=1 Tax=Westerdykella ornata TaxID=318751 RepID=A0A6A6JJ10_WESOR|nr:DHH phosphoesterase [Westerdykella ornata]KAF2276447.1 DHH phosphoesterase [Westerdykella ornata]